MQSATQAAETDFQTVSERIRALAQQQAGQLALVDEDSQLDYAQLDALMDRVAAALQRDGVRAGDVVAVCAFNSVPYAALFLGALRAGVVVAPLAPSSTAEALQAMLADAQARLLFVDEGAQERMPDTGALPRIALDGRAQGQAFADWLAPPGQKPEPVSIQPEHAFNIIYSSGTTGTPKGIVQSHGMRWMHVCRGEQQGYGPGQVTLLSTPLYSNTTLVVFFPSLAHGSTVVLMPRFDALRYLQLAEQHRVTHTMLVPVQYQRIMDLPQFGDFDLSSFQLKLCTSAPFHPELMADVLARWPGGLTEYYGMTEGGGTFILNASEHPDKLHTVGQPAAGHDIRMIDEGGRELAPGEVGEVVGHSPGMMLGYHRQPELTREAEWFDASGKRFIRTGDVGRFDEDGFLVLMDRRKDMIISGGFNIYPSDLEAQLRQHPAVADVAVVGVPSRQWGETPVAFVVPVAGPAPESQQLLQWFNERVGKTQRLADLQLCDELPRSAIGKVLKRELRDAYEAAPDP